MNDNEAIGLLETTGFSPAMIALDAMEKSGRIRVLQAELNDMLGVVIKIAGDVAGVETALKVGWALAEQMRGEPVTHMLRRPDPAIGDILLPSVEYNPLIQQNVVVHPASHASMSTVPNVQETQMPAAIAPIAALGFIETQGFTAVFAAIDTACKAANVEVVGKEKLGGGYVTVVIKGDVAAVNAAVEAAKSQVDGLGKLIAAHVVTRPSPSVLSILPG